MGLLVRLGLVVVLCLFVVGEVEEFFITGPNQLQTVATDAYLVS